MRSLVRQRTSAAARLRCHPSLYRLTPISASRGGVLRLSPCCASIENSSRCYSTTLLLRKQLPTSTGSASSAAATTRSAAGSSRSRKHAASAAAAAEPELETAAPVAATAAVTAQHRSRKAATGGRGGKPTKRGRRKQGTGAGAGAGAGAGSNGSDGLRSNTPTVRPTSSTTRKRHAAAAAEATAAPPPVEPPTAAADLHRAEGDVLVRSTSTSTRAKKKVKEARGKRRVTAANTNQSSDDAESVAASARFVGVTAPSVTVALTPSEVPGAAAQSPLSSSSPLVSSPTFDSLAPVYYTHNMLDTAPRTEEQRMAERCSITKLIMVSASVSFLFTALPRSDVPLKMYVRDMNRVQLPSTPAALPPSPTTAETSGNAPSAARPVLTSKEFHELRQRLCAEQYATNTVFIHVREMEQLVPPLHLQAAPITTTSDGATSMSSQSAAGTSSPISQSGREGKTRSRRGRRSRVDTAAADAAASAPPSTASPPLLPVLNPVERLLALQEWKKTAARRAKETQARYPIPAHFHAITRVRFHDPHQTDLTVAMGGGWSKSTDSVLRAIVRSMHQEERGGNGELSGSDGESNNTNSSGGDWMAGEGEDDDDTDSSIPPFPMPDPAFTNNEVMTEAAADIPEAEQPAFLTSPYAVKPLLTVCASCVPRREALIGTCSPKPFFETPAAGSGAGEVESPYAARPLPTVPRFSTRITIMLEHDEMDPADLVSLAEISTTRKPAAATAAAAAAHAASSTAAYNAHPDVLVRGGGVDANDFAGDLFSNVSKGRTTSKRPLQLYCLVQDAGEY